MCVPRSGCTQATPRETESAASIALIENRRCGKSGSERDRSNLDMRRHERGGSRYEPMGQRCTCRSTMCALRTPRVFRRRCLNPNHLMRMPGNRLSRHVLTCFRGDHRRVAPRRAGRMDTGFHQMMFSLRTRRDATCQSEWVRNLRSYIRLFSENLEVEFFDSEISSKPVFRDQ